MPPEAAIPFSMHEALTAFFFVGTIASLGLLLTTHLCARIVFRRSPRVGPLPPITILKPLKGVFPGLFENLASIARQDYPNFEIIFGCESALDPAVAVAREIKREFPHVSIRVVTGAPSTGYNPKVNNLRHMEGWARHDVLLISDADVRVPSDYLRRVAVELRPDVGLVCSAFAGMGERSLGAVLENVHLTCFVTGAICGADVLTTRAIVVGKSMLFRRQDLRRIGGWQSIADVLAEDFVFADRITKSGRKVVLCPLLVPVVNVKRTVKEFWDRHTRWGQMRRRILPVLYWMEPLLLPSPWLFGLLVAALASPKHSALAVLALVGLLVRPASDMSLLHRVRGDWPHPGVAPLSVFKDFVMLATWVVGIFRTTVEWRGNVLRIGKGSTLLPIGSSSALPTATVERG